MTSSTPLVSTIMSVYNAEKFVGEAIDSILKQTYRHFEFIILVDEGSTDDSAGVVGEFAARDPRIRMLRLPHCSQSHALNVGIEMARGEWIAFLEADDVTSPNRFAIQLDWVNRTGVEICGSLAKRFGLSDLPLWFPESHEAIRSELVFKCVLLPSTAMMQASIAKAHPFNEQAVWLDYEMWTRLAPLYRMGNIQQFLTRYRHHPQQTTVVKAEQVRKEAREFRNRYLRSLLPEASAADYAAIAEIAERRVCADLSVLERGGGWLVRLAQPPDIILRRWMASRWRDACFRSAALGPACYRLYRRIVPQFGIPVRPKDWPLRAACALRIRPGSRLGKMFPKSSA